MSSSADRRASYEKQQTNELQNSEQLLARRTKTVHESEGQKHQTAEENVPEKEAITVRFFDGNRFASWKLLTCTPVPPNPRRANATRFVVRICNRCESHESNPNDGRHAGTQQVERESESEARGHQREKPAEYTSISSLASHVIFFSHRLQYTPSPSCTKRSAGHPKMTPLLNDDLVHAHINTAIAPPWLDRPSLRRNSARHSVRRHSVVADS
jgi:hypothetical protein